MKPRAKVGTIHAVQRCSRCALTGEITHAPDSGPSGTRDPTTSGMADERAVHQRRRATARGASACVVSSRWFSLRCDVSTRSHQWGRETQRCEQTKGTFKNCDGSYTYATKKKMGDTCVPSIFSLPVCHSVHKSIHRQLLLSSMTVPLGA